MRALVRFVWLVRPWRLGPWLIALVAALALPACKSAVPPTGFGVDLTVDARSLSARASVATLSLLVSGAETFDKQIDVRSIVPGGGLVHARYVPGVDGGALLFTIDALDAASVVHGGGSGGPVTLVPGAAVSVTVTLTDAIIAVDGGGDLGDAAVVDATVVDAAINPLCTNRVLDPGELDIDCGGICPLCEPGSACMTGASCVTNTCINGICELATGPPGWLANTVAALPIGRAYASAAGLDDGMIYVFGGVEQSGNNAVLDNSVLAYSPDTNAWTASTALPETRAAAGATSFALNTQIVVVAGMTGTTVALSSGLSTMARFDASVMPPTDTELMRTLPNARAYLGAALGGDGLVYVSGGEVYPATTPISTFAQFDPVVDAAGTVTAATALLIPRSRHGSAADSLGRIVVAGGFTTGGALTGSVDLFDTTQQKWSSGPPLSVPRAGTGAALAPDGRVYVVGGGTGMMILPSPVATVEALSSDGTRIVSVTPLDKPRLAAAVATGWDGRIYAIGGVRAPGVPLTEVSVYGPRLKAGPASGPVGTVVALSGTNFAANANVRITLTDGPMITGIASAVSDDTGTLSPSPIWIVPQLPPGSYVLTAVDDRSRYRVRTHFVVQ